MTSHETLAPGDPRSGKRRGRRPTISRDELVRAARELGPDGIGLQAVADALGVTRTSLYYYVKDQTELGRLVLSALMDEATNDRWLPGEEADWSDWLEAFAVELRRKQLSVAPWMRYAQRNPLVTERSLAQMDRLMEHLVRSGFTMRLASQASVFVTRIVTATVHQEAAALTRQGEASREMAQLAAERDRLRTRPDNELRSIRKAWDVLERTDSETQFRFELRCALDGIREFLAREGAAEATPARRSRGKGRGR
jgi:AcrR family transcriptional regulator